MKDPKDLNPEKQKGLGPGLELGPEGKKKLFLQESPHRKEQMQAVERNAPSVQQWMRHL